MTQRIRIDVTEVAPALAAKLLSDGSVDTILRCHDTGRYTVSAGFTTRKTAMDFLLRVADVPTGAQLDITDRWYPR